MLVTGTRIVGRAFVEAYKQAAANAAARKAAASGKGGGGSGDPLTRKTGMTLDEAHKILNVQANTEMVEIVKVSQLTPTNTLTIHHISLIMFILIFICRNTNISSR